MGKMTDRLMHAWNAFLNVDQERTRSYDYGTAYGGRPDRVRLAVNNERSIISAIYTRLAIDVAAVPIRHVQLDEAGRYLHDRQSGLNDCLTVEANTDQAQRLTHKCFEDPARVPWKS